MGERNYNGGKEFLKNRKWFVKIWGNLNAGGEMNWKMNFYKESLYKRSLYHVEEKVIDSVVL